MANLAPKKRQEPSGIPVHSSRLPTLSGLLLHYLLDTQSGDRRVQPAATRTPRTQVTVGQGALHRQKQHAY